MSNKEYWHLPDCSSDERRSTLLHVVLLLDEHSAARNSQETGKPKKAPVRSQGRVKTWNGLEAAEHLPDIRQDLGEPRPC